MGPYKLHNNDAGRESARRLVDQLATAWRWRSYPRRSEAPEHCVQGRKSPYI